MLVDNNELDFLADFHTKTDLGEGCIPVGRYLGLLQVKTSLSSFRVEGFPVAPKTGIVVESHLCTKVIEYQHLVKIYKPSRVHVI